MKKGFTLIELLAVIVILAIVALIATPLILNVIDEAKKGSFKSTAYGIIKAAELRYAQDMLDGTNGELAFTYSNGVEESNPSGKQLDYKGTKPKTGTIIINNNGKIKFAIHDGKYCAEKGYEVDEVTISTKLEGECILAETPVVTYTYYNVNKGVNAPLLATGMTPIKWNGTDWENTTSGDTQWYDYENKKWANARTEDGSFWVWIPRYAYQIEDGFHTSDAGTINIKFLIDKTNTTIDGTSIALTPTYSGSSQTNFVTHPAFKFGDDEISGIWVAKFEPTAVEGILSTSGTCNISDNDPTKTIQIIPNAVSWRCITIGNAFDISRQMEINPIYGWGDHGQNIDTHLMRDVEWGAIAYLTQSRYGKNDEVWKNSNNNYLTGCAGDEVSAMSGAVCNQYNTVVGQQASTTGNIYGVYDISGGAYERIAAYVNNNHSYLATYGNSLLTAESKYVKVYAMGASDNEVDNYEANNLDFGNAIWETSLTAVEATSWYGDSSMMPYNSLPWLQRGGHVGSGTNNEGTFNFSSTAGSRSYGASFRPILLVGEGL
jgi:prepilin-type N-terminal cleavage/methylation domain-containing protein